MARPKREEIEGAFEECYEAIGPVGTAAARRAVGLTLDVLFSEPKKKAGKGKITYKQAVESRPEAEASALGEYTAIAVLRLHPWTLATIPDVDAWLKRQEAQSPPGFPLRDEIVKALGWVADHSKAHGRKDAGAYLSNWMNRTREKWNPRNGEGNVRSPYDGGPKPKSPLEQMESWQHLHLEDDPQWWGGDACIDGLQGMYIQTEYPEVSEWARRHLVKLGELEE